MKITEENVKFIFSVIVKNISAFEVLSEQMPGAPFQIMMNDNKKALDIMFPKFKEEE